MRVDLHTKGFFPSFPVMWTVLRRDESLADSDFAVSQLLIFIEFSLTFCTWTTVFLQYASAEYTDIQYFTIFYTCGTYSIQYFHLNE